MKIKLDDKWFLTSDKYNIILVKKSYGEKQSEVVGVFSFSFLKDNIKTRMYSRCTVSSLPVPGNGHVASALQQSTRCRLLFDR